MKKVFLCILFVALSVSIAFSNTVENFIDEICNDASKVDSEQLDAKFKTLLTPERVNELIKSGDNINAAGKGGYTILMLVSVFSDNPDIVRDLIQAGADVNAKDDDGYTALIAALASDTSSNPEIIKLLIEAGADVDYKDKNGFTAKDYAKRNQNSEIREIFSRLQ